MLVWQMQHTCVSTYKNGDMARVLSLQVDTNTAFQLFSRPYSRNFHLFLIMVEVQNREYHIYRGSRVAVSVRSLCDHAERVMGHSRTTESSRRRYGLAHFSPSRPDRALDNLTQRAERARTLYVRHTAWARTLTGPEAMTHILVQLRRCPSRFWLHVVIMLVVPFAIALNQWLPAPSNPKVGGPQAIHASIPGAEIIMPLGPIELDSGDPARLEELPAPDSAFEEIMALPEVQQIRSRQDMLAPVTIATTVVGDNVNVRAGPGQVYDVIDTLVAGTPLTLERVAEDWFVVRTDDGRHGWVAAEVVADAEPARSLLAPATEIPPPPPPKIATVIQDDLNVRDGPGTAYVKLHTVDSGSTIDLLSRFENWFEVRLPDGHMGWVTGDYLQIAEGVVERLDILATAPDPTPLLVTETDGTIHLRGGPGTAYPKVGTTGAGVRLDLVGRYKDWLKVRTSDGTLAWVAGEVLPVHPYIRRRIPATNDIPAIPKPQQQVSAQTPLAPRPTRSAPALSPAQAGGIASFALQFTGTPYVWGGSRPGAFDCSGFTKYVYGQYGLNLPHSAAGQYSQNYGTFIDRGNLQPGDLVFFANTYKRGISHVGVYLGGGVVAQALAPGTPLAAVSMNSTYWNSKYYGALRPRL